MRTQGNAEEAERELGRRSWPGSIVYFLVVVVVALSTSFFQSHPWLTVTVGALLLILGMSRAQLGRRLADIQDVVRIHSLRGPFRLATLGSMGVWGVFCGIAAYVHLTDWQGMLVLLSGGALAAGTTASLSPDRRLAWTGLATLIVPTIVAALARGDAPGLSFGFLTSAYLVFLLVQAHQNWIVYEKTRTATETEKARMEAETTARARSALLANVSHEIRTPINGMVGMLEQMIGEDLPNDQRERASMAHASALQLARLLDRVLQYSKVEAGGVDIELTPFDLRRAIEVSLAPIRVLAIEKGLRLSWTVESGVHQYYIGDSIRVGQVISNLASNAVKFTAMGEVRIVVSLIEMQPERDLVQFQVTDTGIGISPEATGRIFEPYVQETGGISRSYGGTGLGLAISRELVHRMGGEITVRSELKHGSEFTFTLPLERVAQLEVKEAAAENECAPQISARVLLAEDNAISRIVTVQLLHKHGFEVDVVGDGLEAVSAVSRRAYDVILMDCQMPGMDGCEAARLIRQSDEAWKHTPIVALTAGALKEDRRRVLDAGMDAFLTKPITSDRLWRTLAPFLRDRTTMRRSHA